MPSFADSFWSVDFHSGIDALFTQLHKGCAENNEFLQIFSVRMAAEYEYGQRMLNQPVTSEGSEGLAAKSSACQAKAEIGKLLKDEGAMHLDVSSMIEDSVIVPFEKWSAEHKQRIEYSEKVLRDNLKVYNRKKVQVVKAQKAYFNKCRSLEDHKLKFTEDELKEQLERASEAEPHDTDAFGVIGGIEYDYVTLRETLKQILTSITFRTFKLPLIGYPLERTNTGSEITKFLGRHLQVGSVDTLELFGQDLIKFGFLKLVNGVLGRTNFVNSSSFQYQWTRYAFEFAGIANELGPDESLYKDIRSKLIVDENNYGTLTKEVATTDAQYKNLVDQFDKVRCDLEELIVDHLSFMEKCEFDRLKALRKVTLDFMNVLVQSCDQGKNITEKLLEVDNKISPVDDLKLLLATHGTGVFKPRVITYDNYYENNTQQMFGIPLETRCRLDKKVVPHIVSSILQYMDDLYPDMENDAVRSGVWTKPVKLNTTHSLRFELQKGTDMRSVFTQYKPEVVASVLKIYLLELPEALIPCSDLLAEIYNDEDEESRIQALTKTLSTLNKVNIATLEALCTHFTRLLKIFSENDSKTAEDFKTAICQEFSNCVVLGNVNDVLGFLAMTDLLTHKKTIFSSLKKSQS